MRRTSQVSLATLAVWLAWCVTVWFTVKQVNLVAQFVIVGCVSLLISIATEVIEFRRGSEGIRSSSIDRRRVLSRSALSTGGILFLVLATSAVNNAIIGKLYWIALFIS